MTPQTNRTTLEVVDESLLLSNQTHNNCLGSSSESEHSIQKTESQTNMTDLLTNNSPFSLNLDVGGNLINTSRSHATLNTTSRGEFKTRDVFKRKNTIVEYRLGNAKLVIFLICITTYFLENV